MGRKRFNITDEKVKRFIDDNVSPYTGLLGEISNYAAKKGIPVIEKSTARFLEIICILSKPDRILEIGTAIGFSAILMCEAADDAIIDTIEIDPEMSAIAADNIKKAGHSSRVNLITADAVDVLSNIDKKYDLIFIDAAKGQYNEYYRLCSDMVSTGGVILADNVLYRGMTAGGAEVNRRQRLLVKRLRQYIATAVEDERFVTDVIPMGDGLCVSVRKR